MSGKANMYSRISTANMSSVMARCVFVGVYYFAIDYTAAAHSELNMEGDT
jgi:hypothetical protein